MQTPVKTTLLQFTLDRRAFLSSLDLVPGQLAGLYCPRCSEKVRVAHVTLEVHDPRTAGCEPTNVTVDTAVPYCPQCEAIPAARGCVHG